MIDTLSSKRDPLTLLTQAWEKNRLGHALLLHGPELSSLHQVAENVASSLLGQPNPLQHPDCHLVRPLNRMRQINVDAIRGLVRTVSHTSNQAGHKVVLISEADRMNSEAANAFLKTLEEPPADTTLFLLTSRPNDLLDTLRSRCQAFPIPGIVSQYEQDDWIRWKKDFREWLARIEVPPANAKEVAGTVLRIYGLVQRFQEVLTQSIAEMKQDVQESRTDEMTEEEEAAILAGKERGQRRRLMAEMEACLRDHALSREDESPISTVRTRKLVLSIQEVESTDGLLALNFQAIAALEQLFLRLLRIWSRQGE